jgi:hypothetical protein
MQGDPIRELSCALVTQRGFYSAYVRRIRRVMYLSAQVYDTSKVTCIRKSMYTTSLRACPHEACARE